MSQPRFALIGSLTICIALVAWTAVAQTNSKFAIGGDFKIRATDRASQEDYAHGRLGPGLLWRFGRGSEGWGFHWGLNWYAVDIDRLIGGSATPLGELHVRPFMAGWGYTHNLRRMSITADVLAGYAIGSIGLESTAVDAYQNRLGAQSVTAHSSNTLVLKPEIGVWYDLDRRFGVNVNAGYMIARPEVVVESSTGSDRRTVRADQFILKVGIVYSIF